MPNAFKIFPMLLIIILKVSIANLHQNFRGYIVAKPSNIASNFSATLLTNQEKLSLKHTIPTI